MTTFTLTVDDRTASFIRHVAAREQKDETLAATQLLEWAATRQGDDKDNSMDEWDDEATFQKIQDVRI